MLTMAGFALVSLPLIFSIILSTTYVDKVTGEIGTIITYSVLATRNNQLLLETITSLERNARQYHVVEDPELLDIYESRHQRLAAILAELNALLPEPAEEIRQISDTAATLLQTLKNNPANSGEVAVALQAFSGLNSDGRTLTGRINSNTDAILNRLQTQASNVQTFLYWQAAILIVVALSMAAFFAIMITRPVRQLSHAIVQLGNGDRTQPISVKGPLDLENLGQRLDWLRFRLHELEQEKNKFLSHVSHELKTPLANVREGAELLKDGSVGALSENQHEVVDILQTNSLILQNNIENLLNFSAWQNMKMRLQYVPCRLQTLFKRVLKQHHLSITRLSLRVETDIPDLEIRADCDKLRIALDNLVANAVKFSPPQSTIRLKAECDREYVNIHIVDEGPGIPAPERDHIFEPFYQGLQAQHGHVNGTGIGLAVVRECILAHNGRIKLLEREPSPGAHFVVQLPMPAASI
jgi:two-component system sensor histidine kinase GlrK